MPVWGLLCSCYLLDCTVHCIMVLFLVPVQKVLFSESNMPQAWIIFIDIQVFRQNNIKEPKSD